jgi:hypothetical protein
LAFSTLIRTEATAPTIEITFIVRVSAWLKSVARILWAHFLIKSKAAILACDSPVLADTARLISDHAFRAQGRRTHNLLTAAVSIIALIEHRTLVSADQRTTFFLGNAAA